MDSALPYALFTPIGIAGGEDDLDAHDVAAEIQLRVKTQTPSNG